MFELLESEKAKYTATQQGITQQFYIVVSVLKQKSTYS